MFYKTDRFKEKSSESPKKGHGVSSFVPIVESVQESVKGTFSGFV